eukprot:355039-Chlamydomonas_euryale.AAC.12
MLLPKQAAQGEMDGVQGLVIPSQQMNVTIPSLAAVYALLVSLVLAITERTPLVRKPHGTSFTMPFIFGRGDCLGHRGGQPPLECLDSIPVGCKYFFRNMRAGPTKYKFNPA